MSTETSSTIGEQRRTNYALAYASEDEFVAAVTEGQPLTPPYFPFAARRNRQSRPLLDEHQPPAAVSFAELAAWPDPGLVVLDTREPADFAAGHLSGALNVGLAGRFAEYTGDVIRPDQPILLVCEPGREVEAKVRLGRIGYDNVVGYLTDPIQALVEHPAIAERSSRLTARELAARRSEIPELVVIDVRNPGELERGVIPGSVHIPLARLALRLGELDPRRPIVVHCASGYRSMIASSLLAASGYPDVSDLQGGYDAWASQARRHASA
jgi:hydroxyacylglutathione hydrolase